MSAIDNEWVTVREITSTKDRKGLLPWSRSKFYEELALGRLPLPARLSTRKSVWRRADIIAWRDSHFPPPHPRCEQTGRNTAHREGGAA